MEEYGIVSEEEFERILQTELNNIPQSIHTNVSPLSFGSSKSSYHPHKISQEQVHKFLCFILPKLAMALIIRSSQYRNSYSISATKPYKDFENGLRNMVDKIIPNCITGGIAQICNEILQSSSQIYQDAKQCIRQLLK